MLSVLESHSRYAIKSGQVVVCVCEFVSFKYQINFHGLQGQTSNAAFLFKNPKDISQVSDGFSVDCRNNIVPEVLVPDIDWIGKNTRKDYYLVPRFVRMVFPC